jgi:hypothetical protein
MKHKFECPQFECPTCNKPAISRTHFLGNVHKKYKHIVSQAAGETGFSVYTGLPSIPGAAGSELVGVYSTETRSHEPFWKRYNELKREQQNK